MELRYQTPRAWVDVAFGQFDKFLLDHALCERKASANGMSFVVRYPDRPALLEPIINYAREELDHFHQVFKVIQKRGLVLPNDEENAYVKELIVQVRNDREGRFLDRLLLAGLMEARGAERMTMVAENLTDPDLKHLYQKLSACENHHRELFVDLALKFFAQTEVFERLDFWLDREATAIAKQPLRPALH